MLSMKQLVTGGAGFIGSNYILHMMKKYDDMEIVCLDKLTYAGNMENLREVMGDSRFRFVQADIADREAVFSVFDRERPDITVNFAAETHVDRSVADSEAFLRTNIIGTGVLLDASKEFKVKRYHQVSTDEVYGDLPIDRPELFFTEETKLHTSSPYSAAKASGDLLVMSYFRTYDMPVTISRCSNNYGRFQFPEKLIPRMILCALANEKLPVYAEGLNVRDWLHVDDHCKAIDMIIRSGRIGEIYNIGGHNERNNITVVRTILRELGKSEELISFVADRPGHDRRYAIDPTKIKRELGWEPETDFETGIRATIKWYVENRDWWMKLDAGF